MLPRNDVSPLAFPIGEGGNKRSAVDGRGHVREFYTISAYIKISLFDLFRQLRVTLVATFPDREGKIKYGIGAMTG